MKCKLLSFILLISSASVGAVEIGAPELTGSTGDIALGLSYYYDESSWDVGNPMGDRILREVDRTGVLGKIAVGLHDNIEVIAKVGIEDIENDPNNKDYRFSSSGDTFAGVGFKGVVYRNDQWVVSTFVQYTGYSNYNIAGTVVDNFVLTPVDVNIEDLSTLEAGLATGFGVTDSLDLFGGLFAYNTDAKVRGTYASLPVKEEINEDRHVGAYAGVSYALDRNWVTTAELHMTSDAGFAIGINYLISPTPQKVVNTEKVIEVQKEVVYVDRPVPASAPVPSRFEKDVFFATNSANIDEVYQVYVRQFADFLKANPKAVGTLEGYCDCDGPNSLNRQLSEKRAEAVKAMLVKEGVDASRLNVVAFGEELAEAASDDAEGKADDRRVRMVGKAQ